MSDKVSLNMRASQLLSPVKPVQEASPLPDSAAQDLDIAAVEGDAAAPQGVQRGQSAVGTCVVAPHTAATVDDAGGVLFDPLLHAGVDGPHVAIPQPDPTLDDSMDEDDDVTIAEGQPAGAGGEPAVDMPLAVTCLPPTQPSAPACVAAPPAAALSAHTAPSNPSEHAEEQPLMRVQATPCDEEVPAAVQAPPAVPAQPTVAWLTATQTSTMAQVCGCQVILFLCVVSHCVALLIDAVNFIYRKWQGRRRL